MIELVGIQVGEDGWYWARKPRVLTANEALRVHAPRFDQSGTSFLESQTSRVEGFV